MCRAASFAWQTSNRESSFKACNRDPAAPLRLSRSFLQIVVREHPQHRTRTALQTCFRIALHVDIDLWRSFHLVSAEKRQGKFSFLASTIAFTQVILATKTSQLHDDIIHICSFADDVTVNWSCSAHLDCAVPVKLKQQRLVHVTLQIRSTLCHLLESVLSTRRRHFRQSRVLQQQRIME